MNNYEKVLTFVKLQNPEYKYSIRDFRMNNNILEYWNPKMGPKPTQLMIDSITSEQINNFKKFVDTPKVIIDIVESKALIKNPVKGSLALIGGELMIYTDTWTSI